MRDRDRETEVQTVTDIQTERKRHHRFREGKKKDYLHRSIYNPSPTSTFKLTLN